MTVVQTLVVKMTVVQTTLVKMTIVQTTVVQSTVVQTTVVQATVVQGTDDRSPDNSNPASLAKSVLGVFKEHQKPEWLSAFQQSSLNNRPKAFYAVVLVIP